MKPLPALAALSLLLLACHPCARADDYQGADAILKQIDAQSKESGNPSAQKQTPLEKFRDDLKHFDEHTATLPPEEAARTWLSLFDRALKLPAPAHQGYYDSTALPTGVADVFEALPPPADWDVLAAQIAARPLPKEGAPDLSTPVLRVVAAMLQGDREDTHRAIETLQKLAPPPANNGSRPSAQVLWDAFYEITGDRTAVLKNFEDKLDRLKTPAMVPDAEDAPGSSEELQVPNLLALTDEAHAEALLKETFALDLSDVKVSDQKTADLARKVALSMGDGLKFAPWGLVQTLDATPLYELLEKHFSDSKRASSRANHQVADAYYLLGLISQARYDDASAVALKMAANTNRNDFDSRGDLPENALTDMATKGYATEVYQFFARLLKDHPELPYWKVYTASAVLADGTDAMLAGVKTASERTDLKPSVRASLRKSYGDALLAADRVPEALAILQEPEVNRAENGDDATTVQANAAARLAGIALLLGDDALMGRQLDAVVSAAKAQPELAAGLTTPWDETLGALFIVAKRGSEWERLLAADLGKTVRDAADRAASGGAPISNDGYTNAERDALCALMDFYCRTGRYADVVALLDHAPQWGAKDVAQMFSSTYYSRWERSLDYQAALALHKTGHDDAAQRLVNAYLVNHGGYDPAYTLLLELLPPEQAEARLNELFRGDQFEERPLIWRAFLQLGQGRLDEAEKSVRQAISIDPSDGEEPRGDRMRAYAVLGDILERKGEKEKAEGMRRAVQAIRLSEDADRLHEAGLLTRAVDLYKKALGSFSDAYCIQSRLAIQLVALGKVDEAMTHYERAYELMPDSFGRMESHCFGCERAFAGERAQGVAEKVFTQLVAKQPDNPRVHYLLGYLRGEEERDAEAAQEYREAVRLDPDYINAWRQLASTTDDPADRDRAALNLLRLDPRRKHDSADLKTVGDLRALWPAVEAAAKFAVPAPTELYPLAASKTALEQQAHPHEVPAIRMRAYFHRDDEPFTPGAVILSNKVITQAMEFLPHGTGEVVIDDPAL